MLSASHADFTAGLLLYTAIPLPRLLYCSSTNHLKSINSPGMLGGRGMGGGSGPPGMLRVVGRAATSAGVTSGGLQTEPVSSSKTQNSTSRPTDKSKSSNQHLSLASSASPSAARGVPPSGLPSKQGVYWSDEDEWVAVGDLEDEKAQSFADDSNLWSVPSKDEVEDAVFALQNFHPATYRQFVRDKYSHILVEDASDELRKPSLLMQEVSSNVSEADWEEPSLHLGNPRAFLPDRVYDAFYLLRTEPSIQKMAKSLSSDEAVWKAVLNNDAVQELKELFYAEKNKSWQDSSDTSNNDSDNDSNEATNFLIWAFANTKTVAIEAIEKVRKFVMELFGEDDHNKSDSGADAINNGFEENLRTSFLISILLLLVVVVSRAQASN